jgi:hypothetical protein
MYIFWEIDFQKKDYLRLLLLDLLYLHVHKFNTFCLDVSWKWKIVKCVILYVDRYDVYNREINGVKILIVPGM